MKWAKTRAQGCAQQPARDAALSVPPGARRRRRFWALAVALAAGGGLSLGCSHAAGVRAAGQAAKPVASSTTTAAIAQATPELFTVPENQLGHLQMITVAPTTLVRYLRLPGTVAYNAFRTTPVITPVGGPVARILVAPGAQVQAGQPLLYVSSPDFAQARATYVKARDAAELAAKVYRRDEDLYEHNALAQADLEAAASAQTQAVADQQNAEQSLRILGFADPAAAAAATSPLIPVRAPIAGEVVDREVAPGQLVQAGTTQCFTISDMHTVWVLVNVYEHDLAYVHVGDAVTVQTDAYPTVFHGRISYIGAALDPSSRTLQARIVTDNPGEELKNQMYATALVRSGAVANAIALPDAAVLRDSVNHPFVYVATGTPGRFARRLVDIGASENGRTQIVSGLTPGERVIADGSLFVQFANSLQQ